MTTNQKAYAEVDAILDLMEEQYVEKIPKEIRAKFKEEKLKEYEPKIDTEKSLNEQNLQMDTLTILATLNLKYWCEKEERQRLVELYTENERKYEEEIREKYNPDNLFKNNKVKETEVQEGIQEKEVEENTQLIEYHENVFIKLWNKIRSWFRKEN